MISDMFHKHNYILARTIHGDEIRHRGNMRSVWKCSKCGKIRLSEHLDKL